VIPLVALSPCHLTPGLAVLDPLYIRPMTSLAEMANKKRSDHVIGGLAAVHVVLHFVVLGVLGGYLDRWSSERPGLCGLLLTHLLLLGQSQAVIVAVWVAWGSGKLLWRLVPTILGALVYLSCYPRSDSQMLMCFTFGEMSFCLPLLLVARMAGLRLEIASCPSTAPRHYQFSIRDLLLWTAALAVVLSAIRCLPLPRLGQVFFDSQVIIAVVVFTCFAGVMMYSSLGSGSFAARRQAVLLAFVFLLCMASLTGMPKDAWELLHIPLDFGSIVAWLIGSFLVVRWAGYRFAWRRPFSGR
jgi:hypothetical protein